MEIFNIYYFLQLTAATAVQDYIIMTIYDYPRTIKAERNT